MTYTLKHRTEKLNRCIHILSRYNYKRRYQMNTCKIYLKYLHSIKYIVQLYIPKVKTLLRCP